MTGLFVLCKQVEDRTIDSLLQRGGRDPLAAYAGTQDTPPHPGTEASYIKGSSTAKTH